uniref:RE24931p n=1 Tax=Drosophila melanogaster TaxID=7227 RepID=Q86P25_DROME|nr:RE24931p [Drosophila melanogaster]
MYYEYYATFAANEQAATTQFAHLAQNEKRQRGWGNAEKIWLARKEEKPICIRHRAKKVRHDSESNIEEARLQTAGSLLYKPSQTLHRTYVRPKGTGPISHSECGGSCVIGVKSKPKT